MDKARYFYGLTMFFLFLMGMDLCAANRWKSGSGRPQNHAGLFTERAFYPYFCTWLRELKAVPRGDQTRGQFRNIFIDQVFEAFPSFALVGYHQERLADIFAHVEGRTPKEKVKNCLTEQRSILAHNIAGMIACHCDTKWVAAHPEDAPKDNLEV